MRLPPVRLVGSEPEARRHVVQQGLPGPEASDHEVGDVGATLGNGEPDDVLGPALRVVEQPIVDAAPWSLDRGVVRQLPPHQTQVGLGGHWPTATSFLTSSSGSTSRTVISYRWPFPSR